MRLERQSSAFSEIGAQSKYLEKLAATTHAPTAYSSYLLGTHMDCNIRCNLQLYMCGSRSVIDQLGGLGRTLVQVFGKDIATFVALVLIAIVSLVLKKIWNFGTWIRDYFKRINRALDSVRRVETPQGKAEGKGIWLTEPIDGAKSTEFINAHDAGKVLIVANAKGGVGKTTTAANLGAYFAKHLAKPVLMIDLDFQGTMSSMAIAADRNWVPPNGLDSQSNRLISGDLSINDIISARAAAGEPNLRVITAFYDLAQAENRIMVEWLLGDRKDDIRFRLANILHQPLIRETFGLVIIDSPPRLTTAAIQGLAAATHLLIPTVLDAPSTEAVVTFVRQVETFRQAGVCPRIQYLGVAGSMQAPNVDINPYILQLNDRLKGDDPLISRANVRFLGTDLVMPRSVYFQRAVSEGGIAYIVMGNSQNALPVKGRIEALGTYVQSQMGL